MVTVFLSRVNKRIWYDLKHVYQVSHEMHVIFTSRILQMIHKTKIALVVFKSHFFNKALVKNISSWRFRFWRSFHYIRNTFDRKRKRRTNLNIFKWIKANILYSMKFTKCVKKLFINSLWRQQNVTEKLAWLRLKIVSTKNVVLRRWGVFG